VTEIRLDGEKLLKHIETIEGELNQIRREAAMGSAPSPSVQGIDLTQIEWKGKNSVPASAGDNWAWDFAYEEDGEYKPESRTLVQAIEQYGEVVMDGYKMTLSGRDKSLISRKKAKSKGRGR